MLKRDDLKKDPDLAGLSDVQFEKIERASANDEQVVIHAKRAEFYSDRDADIYSAFGIAKLDDREKSTDYFKRSLELKVTEATKAEKAKLTKLEAEKAELEKQIGEGKGDEALKRKLHDKEAEVESWKAKHQTDIEGEKSKVAELEAKMRQTAAKAELDKGKIGLTFKPVELFPEKDRNFYIDSVDKAILDEFTPDLEAQPGKTIWRDKKGEIVRNPNNLNEPITISELYAERLKPVLDGERKIPGAGSAKPKPIQGQNGTISIAAKSKVDFTTQVTNHLLSSGVATGTDDFDKQFQAIKAANPQYEALPFNE